MQKSLTAIAKSLESSSAIISTRTEELVQSTNTVSANSAQTASSLEEISSSVAELSSVIQQNSAYTSQAAGITSSGANIVRGGQEKIKGMISIMKDISDNSTKVSEILEIIDGIAFQTNLLALNAAVEAARAGEQGRGFAVVADAVRTLAQKCALAAKDIGELINQATKSSQSGVSLANASEQSLSEIVKNTQEIAALVQNIAKSSSEETLGISQVNKAISEIDQNMRSIAVSMGTVSNSTSNVDHQSKDLRALMAQLQVLVGRNKNESSTYAA